MSLRDEHLQQALKHAPDSDLAPNEALRAKVLDYASKAVKPRHETWLKRSMNLLSSWRVSSWQLAGMSSVAVALLVVVMVREQLPDESIWVKSEVKDIAQNKVETPVANAPQQEKFEGRQNEPARGLDAASSLAEKQTSVRAEGAQAKAKNNLPADTKVTGQLAEKAEIPAASPQMADKANVAVAAAPAVAPHDVAEQGLSKGDKSKSADTENKGRLEVTPEKKLATTAALPATVPASEAASVGPTEQKNELEKAADGEVTVSSAIRGKVRNTETAAKPPAAVKKASVPDEAKAFGIEKANKDIQAGVLRILHLGNDWPTGKPLVDNVTGYRVELLNATTISPAELEAYNQTMRDWYQAHH